MMKDITIDLAAPLICDWLQLYRAFEPLHQGEKAEVDRLWDVFWNSMPAPDYKVAVPGKRMNEWKPRPGDNFKCVINPLALMQYVKELSAKRGFPYDDLTAANIVQGKV